MRLKDRQSSKEYCLVLTKTQVHYAKTPPVRQGDHYIIVSRAIIDISWLLLLFDSFPDCDGKEVFYISLLKSSTKVVFSTSDPEQLARWRSCLYKAAVGTDFKKRYAMSTFLGQGAFARVYRIKDLETSKFYACKKFDKVKMDEDGCRSACTREIEVLRQMWGHPSIVEIEEVYEDESSVYLVLELLEGSHLFNLNKKYDEKIVIHAASTVLNALVSLEEAGITHRDLKPANIHLKHANVPLEANTIKVFDFGIASISTDTSIPKKVAGTLGYIAPENFSKEAQHRATPKSDIFSLGVILYNAVTGLRLFHDSPSDNIVDLNRKAYINFRTSALCSISPRCEVKSP